MLIVDQLRKDDHRLRWLAVAVMVSMLTLAGGLWRLQVMAARRYSRSEEAQSVRLVRVPAIRGKVLDRNGIPLAENRPSFDVNLYFEELRPAFVQEYTNRVLPELRLRYTGKLTAEQRRQLQELARVNVYSNTVYAVARGLNASLVVNPDRFLKHYRQDLALPLPIAENLAPSQMALFFERCQGVPGVDLEVQTIRAYPLGRLAAHVLGHLQRSDESENDPDLLVFRYRLRDHRGVAGLEGRFDDVLRGRAGVKALRVNSQGYRHEETILQPTEPGSYLRLTLDVPVQLATERALAKAAGPQTRGAAVVMDVRNGDLLALVSAPAFDPNEFLGSITPESWAYLNDEKQLPQMNRAVSGKYAPGSIFKIIVAMAALEAGVLDPRESHHYLGYWPLGKGQSIDDLAAPGDYDFKRAFKRSSNAYFIDHGLKAGRARIVSMAERFGLGKPTGVPLGPEAAGDLPDEQHLAEMRARRDPWTDGDTAHLSIGQGAITVSPLQMAVMTATVANGGRLVEPRLVQRIESAEGEVIEEFPSRVRLEPAFSAAHLSVVQAAMLADVEDSDGTGRESAIPGWRVCGKTGTAEIKRGRILIDKVTWFVAYAPYEAPRYAVVVVIESGGSGGHTSAPVAKQILLAVQQREAGGPPVIEPRGRSAGAQPSGGTASALLAAATAGAAGAPGGGR